MQCFKLSLAYDGTGFEGWQAQAGGRRTVQGVVEEALGSISGASQRIVGAGRTDAGVHAEGQVASARLETRLSPAELQRALNAKLPPDVAVRSVEAAAPDFHARFDARGKRYRYALWNGRLRDPLRARFSHHVPVSLDLPSMARAAARLVGRHDFAGFQGAGSQVRSTTRTLYRTEVRGVAGHGVVVELEGDGFLRHMVRNVVGTLLDVGLGRRPEDDLLRILESRDRGQAGATAPAKGLCLVRVVYAGTPALGGGRDRRQGGISP